MAVVTFRFYGELNDFLPPRQRQRAFCESFSRRTSVKDMIEAIGVPHPEVALIIVDATAVGFNHIVADGERIAVYPAFRRFGSALDAAPGNDDAGSVRFVLDANLGALARRLRLCGFDALYRNDIEDDEFAAISAREGRLALTRDRDALKRRCITAGYFVRSDQPESQLAEVFQRYALSERAAPLTRCARCNGCLERVAKAAISHRLEPLTRRHFDYFRQCRSCGQVYWRGSHVAGIERLIERLRSGRASC